MYLWQPIPGGFYAPCVDGDFDMSVIGHEYTHAITNRMIGGPNAGIRGHQGGAMGESWSDLVAVEYLNSNGYVPLAGENPFAVGSYVTGDHVTGIRNYGMNASPLNYSDVGYDVTGPQVHADGEIWSATNYDLRVAMGHQIWRQVMFDAFLLMPSAVSMLDARDAYLAADQIRYGGTHQAAMWDVFARRGFGNTASTNTNADTDPITSFASPMQSETAVTFDPRDPNGNPVAGAQLFVGHFQARANPVADTSAATTLGTSVDMVGGTYDFLVRANGYGLRRVEDVAVSGTGALTLSVTLPTNLASQTNGAVATGDGVRLSALIDDERGDELGVGRHADRRQAGHDRSGRRHPARAGLDPGERHAVRGPESIHGAAPVPDPGVPRRGREDVHVAVRLHHCVHEPGRCLPGGAAAASVAAADHPVLRPVGKRDAHPVHRAAEPVHGRSGLPGRP
jgi:extracellular elastinolytic metalloproteinase